MIVGDKGKYGNRGAAYAFVLAGYILWDEVMRIMPIIGISSRYSFGVAVALYGDRSLVGADESDKKGDDSGSAYIFHRVNGVCQGEENLVPADGASGDWFGYDVDISGDTDIIGYPRDGDIGHWQWVCIFFHCMGEWNMGGGTETCTCR